VYLRVYDDADPVQRVGGSERPSRTQSGLFDPSVPMTDTFGKHGMAISDEGLRPSREDKSLFLYWRTD
jgi:hypothetical protein